MDPPLWYPNPKQTTSLLYFIGSKDSWRRAIFPQNNVTSDPDIYKVYIDILLEFRPRDPFLTQAEGKGLLRRVEGGWAARRKFGAQVVNPVEVRISSLKSAFKAGRYHHDLKSEHPYYFKLRGLITNGKSAFYDPPSISDDVDVAEEPAQAGKNQRMAIHPPSPSYEDEYMPKAGSSSGTGSNQPSSSVPRLSPSWDKRRHTSINNLLHCIDSNRSWRQACFPERDASGRNLYGIYIDIFLQFFKNDPVMEHAERDGLVRRVDGTNGKKKWVATKKFRKPVVNPVEEKIWMLTVAFKRGLFHDDDGFHPSWYSWNNVPDHVRADLKTKHPYYFKLRALIQASDPTALSGNADVEEEAEVKRPGKGKRAAIPPPSSSSEDEDMADASDREDDANVSRLSRRKHSSSPLPVSVSRKRPRVLPPSSPSHGSEYSEDSSVVFLEQRVAPGAREDTALGLSSSEEGEEESGGDEEDD
ncbi:hypothetical protein B9479_007778 [Cryptococcus floricola]|uniref:Uncharacterized protein n=1 Tax=Cryptococcus floricola TaxID=2591691 RepID=A0A5D3AL11_9TREE|nr:hypothetical protein B9479_007778 [Cryptococcus floricola]